MSSLTPSKRPHNSNSKESNGKKFQKLAIDDTQRQAIKTSPITVLRVLLPSSKVGSVIGDGDNIILQICQETGAKVRVDDAIPGCDERVIVIMGPDSEDKSSSEEKKIENDESKSAQEQAGSKDEEENNADKEAILTPEDSPSDQGSSCVLKALLLVFEKIIEKEKETEGCDAENGSATVTLRLLVFSSQVGCLLGKGGSVIKQMSSESGAQIRVLPRDKLPQCATSADEVVQITGLADNVKKAIKFVSNQVMENRPRDHDLFPSDTSGPPSHLHSHSGPRPGGFHDSGGFQSNVTPLYPKSHDNFMPPRMDGSDKITFRLLCPDERVGGIIGKGGYIIKTLQRETGCDIKVIEGTSDGEERLIIVSGPAHPDDRISVVQDAVLRVQHRIAKAIPDSKEKTTTAKILVSSHQIGCLIGKGGSVIGEMRKATGAYIRILGKDQIPKCASENEEVVQINGELEVVQEAVLHITTRLQHHFFRDAFPSINHPPNPFSDRAPPPFMGRREFSPPGMFPRLGPSFRNSDFFGGPPPHGGFHPRDDPPFMHDIHRPGIPSISERAWHPQSLTEGGPMGMMDYGGHRQMPGFGGGSQQAVITNTTIEVVVPSAVVPSIYGEDGGCLRQIRQISDAKITITDPKPGVPETMIIISGTPEQTHAAQSLIQAFVMIENESS